MKRILQNIAVLAVLTLLVIDGTPVLAQGPGSTTLPRFLNYQGVLTDDGRRAVADGPYTMTFRIYTAATGGAPIWSETQTVTTLDGVFDAYLGDTEPLDVAFDRGYWISAQVDGQPEMAPRTRLVPAPYSMTSGTAIGLIGGYVKSLNGLQGDVNIVGGDGIDVALNGDQLELTATGQAGLGEGEIWYGDANDQPTTLPIGSTGQVLNVNAAGNAPEWTSELTLDRIFVRAIVADSVQVNEYINVQGDAEFFGDVTFHGDVNLPNLSTDNLATNAMFIGNAQGKVSELPSTNVVGAVLQLDANGMPTWSPDLNVQNFSSNGDRFEVDASTINFGPANSTTTFEGEVIFNQSPRIPLAEGHVFVGDASGFQAPYAPGTEGQVFSIVNGIPTWTDGANAMPEGTTLNSTLRWNGTAWVENVGLQSDENGNATVGGELNVNNIAPNSSSGEILVSNNGTLESRTVASLLPALPLTQHHVWVGAFGNRPSELAPGTAGQVLTIGATGGPTWEDVTAGIDELSHQSIFVGDPNDDPMELASPGTSGYVLQTDATGNPEWNNSLTIDNLTVEDELNVGGEFTGAKIGGFSGSAAIPINAYEVDVPYTLIKAGATVNVSITDTDAGVGNITYRVSKITPGVGFTVLLSVFYPTSTGVVEYMVINPGS